MAKPRLSRETLLPKLAAHVLAHGLADASLRPLAKGAGTSDRMLIYHFGSKAALMDELLEYMASLYAATLDSAFPAERAKTRQQCLEQVMAVTRRPEFQPFLRVWWEAVAGGAAGETQWRDSNGKVMDTLLGWLESHLPEDEPDPAGTARLMLAIIEGAQMLEAVGRRDIADAAVAKAFAD